MNACFRRRLAAVSLTLLALGAPCSARAAGNDGLSPLDVARLRHVVSVAPSPDGRQIAYVLNVQREPFEDEDGRAWRELHLVDLEGESRPYVTGAVNVSDVAWSPDGKAITFLAQRGDDEFAALYSIPANGGEAKAVLRFGSSVSSYALSPDGRQVAFLAAPPEDPDRIELVEQGFSQIVFEEDWQPKRLWVATLGDDGEEPVEVDLPGSLSELHWSGEGSRLVVASAPTPSIDDHYLLRTILAVSTATWRVEGRVAHEGKMGDVAVSPDGRHIAFIGVADPTDPKEGRPYLVPIAGGQTRDLLPGLEGHAEHVAWRDAGRLVISASHGLTSRIGTVSSGGGEPQPLFAGDSPIVGGLGVAGGTVAFVCESPTHPAEVCRLSSAGGGVERLTDSNPWLADRRLAPQETVRFAARDGLEIEGVLVRPLDAVAGRRYPLILAVHGGPEAHHSNGWMTSYSRPGQLAAARGFAVFYTNYRGSTGRGVEFSKLSQGDPAGKEFDDLIDAVNHLVESGLVDRERVGITGGSYGGYATAWGATRLSEHFAAGVMLVGISDEISKIGTSDIPNELYQVHVRHWPWDDWQLMLERSPIYHLDSARTPLLILHGQDDSRVHPAQSLELYRFLKVRDQAPVRLVLYPDEGHGNRRAASRLDYSLRMLQWMEHYLKGPGGDPPSFEVDYPRPAEGGE